MNIVLGKSEGKNVALDLQTLLTTRLLVTADSGGGKTFALKRICEQLFGHVPILIIDPEGEFAPLREKFPFALAAEGGDTPADVRSAALLAHRALEHRFSLICDIYEMKPDARHEFVRNFINALIEAPKKWRHPTIVIVDEAHMFCPEGKAGESEATNSMKSLCSRGRKRGLTAIFATQRLAELNKGASSMLLNRLVGGTFEGVNQKRALEVLSITPEEKQDFLRDLKLLEPGNFYALGRAICKERKLVHIGEIETPHGDQALKYATAPPPPPEKIKALLPKLSDLPKAAEEKAKTEAELRKEVRELKAQLRSQPTVAKEVRVADPKAIERALEKQRKEYERPLKLADDTVRTGLRVLVQIRDIASKAASIHGIPIKLPKLPKVSAGEIKSKGTLERLTGAVEKPKVHPRPEIPYENNGDLSRPQLAILKAIAEFEAIGRQQISKSWIAARSGASATSSAFSNNLGYLRANGYISYPVPDTAALTEKGRGAAGDIEVPTSSEEMLESCLALLSGPQRKILQALYRVHPGAVDKQTLAEASGASATSSAFSNNLGALRSAGMIDYPEPGMAKASDWIFLE